MAQPFAAKSQQGRVLDGGGLQLARRRQGSGHKVCGQQIAVCKRDGVFWRVGVDGVVGSVVLNHGSIYIMVYMGGIS